MPQTNEIWRPVPGWAELYEVSSLGRVRSLRRQRVLRGSKAGRYELISLQSEGCKKTYLTHRLVARAFIGPVPQGLQVNHKNGNKRDNRAMNLEYVTPGANVRHAFSVLGRKGNRGEHSGTAKLTKANVTKIRELLGTKSHDQIAREFGVTRRTIGRLLHGEAWSEGIVKPSEATLMAARRYARGEENPKAKLTPDVVREIRALAGTVRQVDLAKRFGVTQAVVSKIIRRKLWTEVV